MGPARTRTAAAVTGVATQDEGGDGQRHWTDGAGASSDHSSDHLNALGDLNPASPVFDTSSIDRLEDVNTAPLASAATSATSATSGSLLMLQISANCDSCQNSDGDIDQSAETPTCAVVSWCQLGSTGEPCGMKAAALANDELQEVHVTELETACAPGSQEACVTELETACAPGSQEACVTELETACAPGSQEAQQTGSEGVSSRTDRKLLQNSQCEHEHQNIGVTVQPTGNSCSKESRKRKLDQSAISLLDVTKSPGIPKQARVEDNYNFNNSSTFDIFPGESEVEHKLSRKLSVKRLMQSEHRKMNDTFEEKTWPQSGHRKMNDTFEEKTWPQSGHRKVNETFEEKTWPQSGHRKMNETFEEKTWPQKMHTDDVCVNLREQDDQPPGSVHTDDVCVNLREQDDQPPGSVHTDDVCVNLREQDDQPPGSVHTNDICVNLRKQGDDQPPGSVHTDDVCVNLREQDDQPPGTSQPQAASDRDGVSVGGARSASEASTQQSSEAQPDLWAKMEVLCEEARSPRCASRCRTFSSLADSVIKRFFTEKNYVFQLGPQPKIQSPWNPGVYPGSRVAKHVLAYDDGYHHGNIRTGSHNTKRANSKARSYNRGIRMKKTFSTTEHMVGRSAGRRRYRLRSNSSSAWSSRSRSRSHSPADSCRSHSCGSDNPDEYACDTSSEDGGRYSCHCPHQPGSWPRCGRCHGSTPQSPDSASRLASSRSYSRSRSRYKSTKSRNQHGLDIIQQLLLPLVLPSSVTTLIVAPVTGAATTAGKGNGGAAAVNIPSLGNSIDNKHPNTITSSSPEKTKKVNGGQNVFLPNMGDRNKFESKGSNEASLEANANMSLPPRPQNNANSRMSAARMEAGNPEHYAGPPARSSNHFGEHSEHGLQREQPRYEPHYNNMGYHPDLDHSFSEDAGYEFYGSDYDYMYDERNDDYGFGNEPHPGHMHQRHPGPNTYYPRRPPPQGPRGPPQMFTSNERSYGPPRHGMGGPSSRMGPNGPVGSRGPRSPMGPRGHRPQGGPGGPLGPPVMRGPPRGSPYGPPRGSPYGPPGPMRPQGMRGPPGPGMMGQAGHGGPGGPRPRLGPPTRMQSPMPRQGSQPPGGLRPRMGPPPPGPAPREDQYMPPRPGILPSNSGDSNFCSPLPNLSQPPPNFVPSTPSLPPTTSTPVPASHITDVVEPPPPLPPPKPPTPKPPPPPKKEEEKKEEIKPMTPLIPPEQAEQYRKLREQARKHARKQQRKQEHQAKGEPESSDDDDEEKAKRKEYEAKLTAEREEMEKAAMLAVQDNGALHYEEGAAILMPATQPALVQQPTMMVQHHPLASPPSSYGLMPASQLVHAGHPGLHPSQLQNLQFMTSAGQPQLVQLPNGQMAYAMTAPMAYQAAAPTMAMQHQAMSAGAVPHHILLSSGGMHQVPVTAHPGLAVSGSPYMAQYVMATQMQAAQIQAAQMQAAQIQAAQVQAAQAAQVQAAQAAQVQAAQAAQIQAAQAAQVQAAQAAQVQAAQVQSGMPGLVSGVHMGQHVLPGTYPQGQYILVPRMARPQI